MEAQFTKLTLINLRPPKQDGGESPSVAPTIDEQERVLLQYLFFHDVAFGTLCTQIPLDAGDPG